MKRRINPQSVLTVLVLLGVFAVAWWRAHRWQLPQNWGELPQNWGDWKARLAPRAASSPEDGIYAMLDAARAGNTRAYLDCFSGPLREQVAATAKEDSEANFRKYLLSQNSGVQGVALMVTDRPAADQARVRLEYVYTDHNEVQNLQLKQEGTRWKIIGMDGAQPVKSAIPYGTKVTD